MTAARQPVADFARTILDYGIFTMAPASPENWNLSPK